MERAALRAVVVLAAAAGACARSPTGPEALRVVLTSDFDSVTVQWYPPTAGDFEGYLLEWRAAGGTFATLAAYDVSATKRFVDLGPEVPDAADVELRLTAIPNTGGNRSTTAVFHRGPRPPVLRCVWMGRSGCAASADGFHLDVQNRSTGATKLVLTRSKILPGTTAVVPGPSIDLAPDAATYADRLDGDWSEEATYAYALAAVKNGEQSAPSFTAAVSTDPLPLSAPADVSAVPLADGTQVSFVNRSARAQCIEVEVILPPTAPWPHQSASCLPPGAVGATTIFVDRNPALAWSPFHLYRVRAVGAIATSWPVGAWEASPPPTGLTATHVVLSPTDGAVRLSSGAFATFSDSHAAGVLFGPGPSGTVPFRPGWTTWYSGTVVAFAVGPDDVVHALLAETDNSSDSRTQRHAAFAGGAWQLEELSRTNVAGRVSALDVGLDGTVRAGWTTTGEVVLESWSGTGWTTEHVPASLPTWPACSTLSIAGDAAGAAHLVHGSASGTMVHRFRTQAGWTTEPLPVPTCQGYGIQLVAWVGALVAVVTSPSSGPPTTTLLERGDAGWTVIETLAGEWTASRSVNGQQLVLASSTGLRVQDTTGTRSFTRPELSRRFVAGVQLDGRAWILDILYTDPAFPETSALLYEEP